MLDDATRFAKGGQSRTKNGGRGKKGRRLGKEEGRVHAKPRSTAKANMRQMSCHREQSARCPYSKSFSAFRPLTAFDSKSVQTLQILRPVQHLQGQSPQTSNCATTCATWVVLELKSIILFALISLFTPVGIN